MSSGKLSLHNVSVNFGATSVLKDISFSLEKGKTLTVVGPSGCGKSTLLNVLSGIIKNYEGDLFMGTQQLRNAGLTFGYVPQNFGLLAWKKVRDNILLPAKINREIKIDKDEVNDVLTKLELTELLDRYPSQLSGGQRQRVALARVFISHSDILLMDEPFSALDTLAADTSRELFLDLWRKYRPTTIFTTHNLSEAVKLGKHILLLGKQPATVLRFVDNPIFESQSKLNEFEFATFKKKLMGWIREGANSRE
ncbi:MAG: ATP-binding cassette domain-containing protein [Bacteroidales bacterium]|nr:ATP-binding cassette domain-containing protein [Bacteroidales bacterium]